MYITASLDVMASKFILFHCAVRMETINVYPYRMTGTIPGGQLFLDYVAGHTMKTGMRHRLSFMQNSTSMFKCLKVGKLLQFT